MDKKIVDKKGINKKAMSMAIIVLVLLTLILVTLTITYFITSKKINVDTLKVSESIESTYRAARYLDYEMNIVFLRASQNFSYSEGKSKFIEKFNEEFNKYDDLKNKEILSDIAKNEFYVEYSSVDESRVMLTPQRLALTMDISITNKTALSEGLLGVKYNYRKIFEKKLVE